MHIDSETCTGCGTCAALCPGWILERAPDHSAPSYRFRPDRLHLCIRCGHCMAACPGASIHIDGLSYDEDFFPLPDYTPDIDGFRDFTASRRSVRAFKETRVPRALLEKIVAVISLAPMGFSPHKVEVSIIQERPTIEQALPYVIATYERLMTLMRNPIGRWMLRQRMPPEKYTSLSQHVLPGFEARLPEMKASGRDLITRRAPALLVFHARRTAAGHHDDAVILLTYALLAAHALGLGAAGISLLPPVIERVPELRRLFQVPPDNEVCACMIVGYPLYPFKRGIRRNLAGVHWM